MVGQWGRKPRKDRLTSGFWATLKKTEMPQPTVWPMTVARAAPATSIRGRGPRPKMRMGSRMMFTTAPAAWEIMDWKVRPVAWRIRSRVTAPNRPMLRAQQMVR